MLEHLKKALPHLIQVKKHYKHALSRAYYASMHEDIDWAIKDVRDLITALDAGVGFGLVFHGRVAFKTSRSQAAARKRSS
ncbi:unnamed protein product, partial [marine sediment metagenome]